MICMREWQSLKIMWACSAWQKSRQDLFSVLDRVKKLVNNQDATYQPFFQLVSPLCKSRRRLNKVFLFVCYVYVMALCHHQRTFIKAFHTLQQNLRVEHTSERKNNCISLTVHSQFWLQQTPSASISSEQQWNTQTVRKFNPQLSSLAVSAV